MEKFQMLESPFIKFVINQIKNDLEESEGKKSNRSDYINQFM